MASIPLLESSDEINNVGTSKGRISSEWKMSKVVDVDEMKRQVSISLPMVITSVSYYSITVVSVMFSGHLGDLPLASATLANSWATVTGFALLTGLSGSLETLCGQAYGAKMFKMLGIYLQSSIIISFIASLCVSIVWFYSETILLWLHQDPEVSKFAAFYLKYVIPGVFSFGFVQCLLRFLQSQEVVLPLAVCSLVSLILHGGITYVLVHPLDLGLKGAAMSTSISLWVSFFMLVVYVKLSEKFKSTWEGMSIEALKQVVTNLKLAIPSAMMVCSEYWAFELLVLLAGLMPNSKQSTSTIAMCVNTEDITYMITYGFSAAVSIRVSNEIGSGNTKEAKNTVIVGLQLSFFVASIVSLSLFYGHNLWASLFSNSHTIVREFANMTPFLTISIVIDSALGVLSGVCRGCGWQNFTAWTSLVTFYAIGMQLALLFGFQLNLHVKGLWIGLICGLFCQACTLLAIAFHMKWKRLDIFDRESSSSSDV